MVRTESLTKRRLQLLEAARDAFGWKSVWSMMGDIYAFVGGKKQVVKNINDIAKLKRALVSYSDAVRDRLQNCTNLIHILNLFSKYL